MKQLFFIFLLGGMIFTACTSQHKSYPAAMQQAEKCMSVYPDSALLLLSALQDDIKYEPKETQMYYHLLTIQAKDKCYIPHTSDSLVNKVVNFYENESDDDKLKVAYYYQGSVYRDMCDAPRAIKAFQQAIDVEDHSNNIILLGQIYGQMGTLFAYQGLYDESLDAKRKALNCYISQRAEKKIPSTLCEMARVYDAKEQNDSAVYYYKQAYDLSFKLKKDKQAQNILSELGCLYQSMGKNEIAKPILLSLSHASEERANALLYLGIIYQEEHRLDSAEYYLKQALQWGDIDKRYDALRALSYLEVDRKDYLSASAYACQALAMHDTIEVMSQTEAVKKIESLYDYQHTEQANSLLLLQNKKYMLEVVSLILLLIILLFAGYYIFYRLKAAKQAAIEQERSQRLLKEFQYMRSVAYLEENNKKLARLQFLLEKAEQENDTLNKQLLLAQKEALELAGKQQTFANTNREFLEMAFKSSDIYLHFHKSGNEGLKITEDDWKELHIAIDNTYPNFTDRLYSLYPNLSQRELYICYLIKISMPNKDMADLLNLTPSAVTQARKRFYKKIYGETGNGELLDKMILDL